MAELSQSTKDFIAAGILLIVAGAYAAGTRTIQDSALSDAVGERGLPNILAVLLVVLALVIAVKAVIERRRAAPEKELDEDDEKKWGARPLRALGFLAIGAGYIAIAPLVGYGVAVGLLILTVALYEGMRLDWRVAAVAAGGGVFFYLAFVGLLGVEQPMSVLIGR